MTEETTKTLKKIGSVIASALKPAGASSSSSNSSSSGTGAKFTIASNSSGGSSGSGSSGGTRNGETVYTGEKSTGSRASYFGLNSMGETKGSSSGSGYGTYEQDLNRLTKAQRQAQIDQLKAARDKALANLDVQEKNIKPTYETARNQVSAQSQQGARNFAEYLANRGLTNSGASAQGEINRLSALQNNLGNLNTAEANALRDIANQRTQVENDYVSGLANANNALTTNYYNNLLNYNEQQRQYEQQLRNQANYQYYDNIQAEIDRRLANGESPNSREILELQALRGSKMANQYNNGMNNALSNVQSGNINYNNAAQLGMTIPQAYQYSNNYLAEQQAIKDATAEQLAYDREQQEFTNNLNYNKYLTDKLKTEAEINNINSQIAKRNKPTATKTPSKTTGNEDGSFSLTDKEIQNSLSGLGGTERETKIKELAPYMTFDQYAKARMGAL